MPLTRTQLILLAQRNPASAVMQFLSDLEERHNKMMEEMRLKMEREMKEEMGKLQEKISGLDAYEKAAGKFITLLSNVKVPYDGKDGKDANEEYIIRRVLEMIPMPADGQDGKDGIIPIAGIDYPTEEQIKDIIKDITPRKGHDYFTEKDIKDIIEKVKVQFPKIELKGEDMVKKINELPIQPEFQFTINRIQGLEGSLRSLKMPKLGGGGGVTWKRERLTPTVSGANITLNLTSLSRTFIDILGVFRQGQLLEANSTSGWTQSGNTITVYNATTDESFYVDYSH